MKERAYSATPPPKAWVVLKDEVTWTDQLKDEQACKDHIAYCIEKGFGDETTFTYREMTDQETEEYAQAKGGK